MSQFYQNAAAGTLPPSVATQYNENVGFATPSGNILNVIGGSNIQTSGSGNTITINNIPDTDTIFISDDFLGVDINGISSGVSILSIYKWFITDDFNWVVANQSTNAHPGVIANSSVSNGNFTGIFLGNDNNSISKQIILGGGSIALTFIVDVAILSTGTNTYTLEIGLGDTGGADQSNGVYFEYSNGLNSGNWIYATSASSTRTVTNSTMPVTAGWHNFMISINAAASSVSFFVDGISLGAPITTNIPTLAITPFVDIVVSAGTLAASSIKIDLFTLYENLTTPR